MLNPIWSKAIKKSADPERAQHFLGLLAATSAGQALKEFSPERAALVISLFSGSQALAALLISHPDWLEVLQPDKLRFARRKQGLAAEIIDGNTLERRDPATALQRLRQFKQREMLRIAARDLARLGSVVEITQEISDVADVCLDCVWKVCHRQLSERYGRPFHQDADARWHPTAGCILGLGKLGGQELNYSSDVDVMFVYSEEGSVHKEGPAGDGGPGDSLQRSTGQKARAKPAATQTPHASLTNHQFFNRLAEACVAELTRMGTEGALYRIDLRLRPEGDAGPLSRSLSGYENYYAQWGQTWERMMLIKTRCVAGDRGIGAEFLEMVQPFRYPRSTNQSVLGEVAAMKDRIESEVLKQDEIERNVKLGRGGIREIEFVTQALQLLHAGRQPFLQTSQTLPALEKLVQYELLAAVDARSLADAYGFLRDVEHRLQMEDNRQTHTIPEGRAARERLARLMQFTSLKDFEKAHRNHTHNVRNIFHKVIKAEAPVEQQPLPFPRHFEGAEAHWKALLSEHGFRDAEKAFRVLREFVEGPGYVHVSPRTKELAFQLLPRFFALCRPRPADSASGNKNATAVRTKRTRAGKDETLPDPAVIDGAGPLSDPDRVVTRLDSYIGSYGARATLFELWHSNPAIFELLVRLFDRSEFLAELAIRTPDLVDELVSSGRLRQRKSAEETLRDLRHGLEDADQHLWLRRYHQTELMRIGLRDILNLADFEQYLAELSALADACLQYALDVAMRKHKFRKPPFVIIGLGKLGGAEIDYGSDLDITFVADSKADNLVKLGRLAVDVMDLLSRRTEQGMLFHTDARLRPDGEKGLLVNSIAAYAEYYRSRAQLWEIQTLTRTRAVAGDLKLGEKFQQLAASLTNFAQPVPGLTAYTADWKSKIHQMRMRIEKERTPAGKDELAIKTGRGGLMDAEFVAQVLNMEHGWQDANTLRALEHAHSTKALPDGRELIDNYRQLRRVEGILRRWSYEGETVLPDDPAPYYRVSVRCGFSTPDAFRRALAEWRKRIRKVYQKVFRVTTP
jgi:glutamate-ammonia-ligase adenylyltransferase